MAPSDLIARSRTGDRDAFAGLVALWADRGLQVALQASRDPEEAAGAVAVGFAAAYGKLPELHRANGFRAFLMRHVLEACSSQPRDERLRVVLKASGPRKLRQIDQALAGLLGESPRLRLPDSFYEERVLPGLQEPALALEARAIEDPVQASALLASNGWALTVAGSTSSRVTAAGAKGRGAVQKPRKSHDIAEVTFRTERRLGWIVRSTMTGVPGEIELCLDAGVRERAAFVRLRGAAIPTSFLGHVSERLLADALPRFKEQLAIGADHAFGPVALA